MAGLVIGEKIVYTLVIPMAALGLCLFISMVTAGKNDSPPPGD